jgi:hypothetical protein
MCCIRVHIETSHFADGVYKLMYALYDSQTKKRLFHSAALAG